MKPRKNKNSGKLSWFSQSSDGRSWYAEFASMLFLSFLCFKFWFFPNAEDIGDIFTLGAFVCLELSILIVSGALMGFIIPYYNIQGKESVTYIVGNIILGYIPIILFSWFALYLFGDNWYIIIIYILIVATRLYRAQFEKKDYDRKAKWRNDDEMLLLFLGYVFLFVIMFFLVFIGGIISMLFVGEFVLIIPAFGLSDEFFETAGTSAAILEEIPLKLLMCFGGLYYLLAASVIIDINIGLQTAYENIKKFLSVFKAFFTAK